MSTGIPQTLRTLRERFYQTDTYRGWTGHNEPAPTEISGGVCGEFVDFVLANSSLGLERMTTASVLGVPDAARPDPWHVWLTDGVRHYDAEHPDGVDTWQSLTYFQKFL